MFILPCKAKWQYLSKAKWQYLLNLQVSRYCLLTLQSSIVPLPFIYICFIFCCLFVVFTLSLYVVTQGWGVAVGGGQRPGDGPSHSCDGQGRRRFTPRRRPPTEGHHAAPTSAAGNTITPGTTVPDRLPDAARQRLLPTATAPSTKPAGSATTTRPDKLSAIWASQKLPPTTAAPSPDQLPRAAAATTKT